ncbi:hypothetical protein [Conexibacter arvalis]|uniref:Uncharacterized protein n=1 Tax=Conexibacter arvalis TaxID=912552 RepID=A0A840I9G6_9ACTN|nr:hypothetical protein [Conexibacter arvalis]MBB4661222.1 hypothetical protein [Conexibacter arvalis]
MSNRDGSAYTQAGGHPWSASTTIEINSHQGTLAVTPEGDTRNITVDLPAGFVGDPSAAPRCREAQLADTLRCPNSTQVGITRVTAGFIVQDAAAPVYSMEPPPGVPATFAFTVAGVVVHLNARVRSDGDYGLAIDVRDIPQTLPLVRTSLTFWGVPADSSHDDQRGYNNGGQTCIDSNAFGIPCSNSAGVPRKAFLTNPMTCTPPGVGLETRLTVEEWLNPGVTRTARFFSHLPAPDEATQQGPEGCDRVPFEASLSATPTSARAGAPTGYVFELKTPQSSNPDGLANAHLKKTVVRLPEGVRVSPSAAAGLEACSPGQIGLRSLAAPACPAGSKIGTLQIDTPLLDEPMHGAIHLARQRDNPFGTLLALYLVARGPGVLLKLPGSVVADPVTGQLTATFDDNPQLPFDRLLLRFADGPRATLTNPASCGVYTTSSELASWTGKTVTSNSSFTISRDGSGAPCPPPGFAPRFAAGLANPVAGSSSTFSLSFGREDDDQTLRDISVDMPRGLVGVIAASTLCHDAAAAIGACGEESRIGSTTTEAGPGPNPFALPGRVYITGPYKGAPYGLSIVVPAVAGPFDLGTVVVRAAIHVDRMTAQLRVVSDPLPSILEGIPLQVRTVEVRIDKAGFMVAPSSCRVQQVAAMIGALEGASSAVSSRFQVGNCRALTYAPRISLRIGARGRTAARRTTPLRVVLTMPRGRQTNNKSVTVTLPRNVNSRLSALTGACTREQFEARDCGPHSVVGSAFAVTPLLRDPLRGNVHIVRTPGNRLPELWVALRGEVQIDLIGRVRIVPGSLQLKTTFGEIPDVAVSRFQLDFIPGRRGAIGLVSGICAKRVRRRMIADLAMVGQNGARITRSQRMRVAGCGRGAARTRRKGRVGAGARAKARGRR